MLNVKKFLETYSNIKEIERCKKDPVYFYENYCCTGITLKNYQKQFLINLTNIPNEYIAYGIR